MFRAPRQEGLPVKVLVHHADAATLRSQGYAAAAPIDHVDTWYERAEGPMLGSIVLRHRPADGSWAMAWETTIRTGPKAERHHLWTAVDGVRMRTTLQRLGMKPVLAVRASRVPLAGHGRRLALEHVQDVGDFLEVPGPDKRGRWAKDVAELLQAVGGARFVHSYRELARPASA